MKLDFTKETIVGKRLLIGINLTDESGKVESRVQVHGTVTACTGEHILLVTPGGEEFYLPPEALQKMRISPPEAVYTIQETKEELDDIDAVASLTMNPAD